MKIFPLLFLVLFLTSCNNEPTTEKEQQIVLPNTPETVARQWQKYVDQDQFKEASELSTRSGKEWIAMLEKFLEGLPSEEMDEVITTEFAEMNCEERGDIARCGYLIKEEGEIIQDTFYLFKVNGQWLVDIPEEATEEGEIEIEGFIDSLLRTQ